jgi:hypothetical protein
MTVRFVGAFVLIAIAGVTVLNDANLVAQSTKPADYVAWVAEALKRMQTIKPGITRRDLLVVFTTEGGISTPLQRTFGSRDCPYFKVDVTFEAVGRPSRDNEGRIAMVEGDQDRIISISRPYLQFGIVD